MLPTRISVAPSSTATRQSCDVPIESCARPCVARELGEPAEGRPAGLRVVRERRHRHQPAEQRVALEVALDLALAHPALRRLAGEVHLEQPRDRQPAGGRVGVDGVDELADLVHDACLVRLERADEVPPERVAVELVLALHVLRPGSRRRPRCPASASTPMSSAATYFVAATTVTPAARLGADGLVGLADGVGVHGSSWAARSSSQARSLRAGSSTTSSRSTCSARPSSGPSANPIARRSSPVTASRAIRCGCERSSLDQLARGCASASSSSLGHRLGAEVGRLVADQVECRARRRARRGSGVRRGRRSARRAGTRGRRRCGRRAAGRASDSGAASGSDRRAAPRRRRGSRPPRRPRACRDRGGGRRAAPRARRRRRRRSARRAKMCSSSGSGCRSESSE